MPSVSNWYPHAHAPRVFAGPAGTGKPWFAGSLQLHTQHVITWGSSREPKPSFETSR